MAEIKGTNVAAPIVPFTDSDIYATHEAKYGKGGWRSVQTYEDLLNIPEARLEDGMFGFVVNDPEGIHSYQWLGGKWVRSKISQGIPVYNQKLIDDLGIEPEADTYISIPNPSDLDGEITDKTYKTSVNGNYVDILFKALRELQSEVAKLKNSFNYGIESYTGTTTAMTAIKSDLDEAVEEEPLWAIMEGSLSEIVPVTLGDGHPFEGDDIHVIIDDKTFDSYINFGGHAVWTPTPSSSGDEAVNEVRAVTDSKLFLYTIVSGSRNVIANLNLYDLTDGSLVDPTKYRIAVDFSKISLPKESEAGIYNILLVISRKQKMGDGNMYGKNFIWMSIGDVASGKTITEGYWKNNALFDNIQELEIETDSDGNDKGTYTFENIEFNKVTLSKFKLYSKYQDFSKEVIPSRPDDESYKFKAAHITIRSVENQATLVSVKDQILNNELIFVEDTKVLWIKSNNLLTQVAGGGSSSPIDPGNSGMTQEEMIKALSEMGIIREENGDLKVNDLAVDDITFIHQATGKRYKFGITEDGSIHSQEIGKASDSFENKIKGKTLVDDVRGFIGQVRLSENTLGLTRTSDARLYSDRLKIGAFYAPFSTDLAHGCSHSYVELENTSDVDFSLDGFYLHYTRPDNTGIQQTYHLPLTGIIPAGGTYLIRGKEHASINDPNVFLKVKTFDQEWYVGKEPISFEINEDIDLSSSQKGYGFCLTYGNSINGSEISHTTKLVRTSNVNDTVGSGNNTLTIDDKVLANYPYILNPYFVDGIYYYRMVTDSSGVPYWATIAVNLESNSIYRNTFELDPAKQAFQAFTTKDSSRARWANVANDIQVVTLDKEFISFPHTDDVFPIANYTPKASFEKKNVSTDKSKLDVEKPNMVTTSFGVDIYRTRCFNWISVGYFPEYVWIKKENDTTWMKRIQSYVPVQSIYVTNVTSKQEASGTKTTVTFNVITKGWKSGASLSKYVVLTDSSHNKIVNMSASYTNGTYTATLSGDYSSSITTGYYFLHSKDDELADNTYPKKKFFSADVTNNVYARLTGRFPGDNSYYVAHKVVADIVSTSVGSKTKYIYVVGRADKNGNPDPKHCSEQMSFTLYPESFKTRIYQTTDQQGFHWIEYQPWAALAKSLEQRIDSDCSKESIIPILMNTGDMTQNGTRINEWFDYYQGGRNLFNHLEQMYVVGNNDLCGPDPSILGTGDDSGKSNSFYFHVFYCYEVGSLFEPLVTPNNEINGTPKYIPSLYYFDSKTDRFLMVNSEITETCCKDWFKLTTTVGDTTKPINLYTGYAIYENSKQYAAGDDFTTIYTMIYRTLNDAKTKGMKTIAICHEMPFTVITSDSLTSNQRSVSRSLSSAKALVGSHLNQISKNEDGSKGIYWFSRLLEFFGVKLVLGGHKHTYSCTYPVRENYTYTVEGNVRDSANYGPMDMAETLENDTAEFKRDKANDSSDDLSKFPLTKRDSLGEATGTCFYPYTSVPDLVGGITYFMCQASGYKLTSNKELPSPDQKFSRIIPETKSTYNVDSGTFKDTASNNQKYPMLAIIDVNSGVYSIKLARLTNILSSYKFTQSLYGTGTIGWQWLVEKEGTNYGEWKDSENIFLSI